MTLLPACPQCQSAYIYADGGLLICPECSHEWPKNSPNEPLQTDASIERVFRDANGNPLQDGDSVTVIRDLKLKGSSQVIKVGTKVKQIRLLPDASDDHDIDCRIDGIGAIKLKSSVVRKA